MITREILLPFMEIVFLEDGRLIRPCGVDDLEAVSELVLLEAKRFIAGDFDEAGWKDFLLFLSTEQLLKRLVTGSKALIIQEGDDQLSGYIEITGNQLLLLFVAERFQGLHLATRLLNRLCDTLEINELFVNSSTKGYDFYVKRNFKPVGEWKISSGIKHRPLKWQRNSEGNQ